MPFPENQNMPPINSIYYMNLDVFHTLPMVWLFFPLYFHCMERYISGDGKLYLVRLHCSALPPQC